MNCEIWLQLLPTPLPPSHLKQALVLEQLHQPNDQMEKYKNISYLWITEYCGGKLRKLFGNWARTDYG